jgi:hypothetical protein
MELAPISHRDSATTARLTAPLALSAEPAGAP